MQLTPYTRIGDASLESAILTNADGYDVAVIERATVRAPGLPAEHHLTDEQWQQVINLVDAAPAMLAALSEAAVLIQTARAYFPKSISNHSRFQLENVNATITAAIRKATTP